MFFSCSWIQDSNNGFFSGVTCSEAFDDDVCSCCCWVYLLCFVTSGVWGGITRSWNESGDRGFWICFSRSEYLLQTRQNLNSSLFPWLTFWKMYIVGPEWKSLINTWNKLSKNISLLLSSPSYFVVPYDKHYQLCFKFSALDFFTKT